jgi:uncharacterized membrane protein YccC
MLTVFLAPGSLNHTANIIKGFAIAIGIVVAIGFVWAWWAARQRERQVEMAGRARAAFAEHLRLALQYPEMAEPMLGAINSPAEIVRYKQFVASLLAAADTVLLYDPSPAWRAALLRQLAPHKSYLGSEEFRSGASADCSAELNALIRQACGG